MKYTDLNDSSPKVTMGAPLSAPAIPGQSAYTFWNLYVQYDIFVLGYSNRYVWQCPTSRILRHYETNITNNHLDVGVGTGYFLKKCCKPSHDSRLGLLDINPNSLRRAALRNRQLKPECYLHDVLQPVDFEPHPFDSIGLTYLFHCLPGTFKKKLVCLDNLRPFFRRGTNIFGATILTSGVLVSPKAHKLSNIYNNKGYFSNSYDSLDALNLELKSRFKNVHIEVSGCVALFQATNSTM